jgi:hypothetical protein
MADSLMMSMRTTGQSKAWKPLNYQKVSIAWVSN